MYVDVKRVRIDKNRGDSRESLLTLDLRHCPRAFSICAEIDRWTAQIKILTVSMKSALFMDRAAKFDVLSMKSAVFVDVLLMIHVCRCGFG